MPTIHVEERRTTLHLGWTAAVVVVLGLGAWGARAFLDATKRSMEVPEHARIGSDLSLAGEMARSMSRVPMPSAVDPSGRPRFGPGSAPPPGARTPEDVRDRSGP